MKQTFFTLFFAAVLLVSCSGPTSNKLSRNANSPADTAKAVIAFTEYEYNFGKVREGTKVSHTFSFENQGEGNLVLLSVLASCGCTVPKYDKKPIASGKGGKLDVEFSTSGMSGMQSKTITVNSNATVPMVILRITADVERKN